MTVSKGYGVLVINTREHQGQALNALVKSLFQQLNKTLSFRIPALTVSIHPEVSDSDQSSSWTIDIKSQHSIRRCLIKEFFFPPTTGPGTITYLLWCFQAPIRAAEYLLHKLRNIWHESSFVGQKTSAVIRIIAEAFDVVLRTSIFLYFFPLLSLVIIRPLRKMGTLATVIYFFLIIAIIVTFTWEHPLLTIVNWTSQFTHQLVNLASDSNLTFDILFPVIAGAIFAAMLTLLITLVRTARWIVRSLDRNQEANRQAIVDLSYLLDPLYAAKVRDNFESQLIDFNMDSNFQYIFVVCERTGALLAYEVLSRICPGKISKPVYLLTSNISFAGFFASPLRSLWLLVDSKDWSRFSENTPANLSWRHFTTWPSNEYSVKIISSPEHTLPKVILHSEKLYWFKGENTAIVDRIISFFKLTSHTKPE